MKAKLALTGHEPIRLDRLLSNLGYCTRTTVRTFIKRNNVTINGTIVPFDSKINPHDVRIKGEKLPYIPPITLMIHKPKGYVCSRKEQFQKKNKLIFELLPERLRAIKIPALGVAGRLDKDVTGVVIMSTDGDLVQRIITPKKKVMGKVYEVEAMLPFTEQEKASIESGGLMLRSETKPLKPAKFELIDAAKRMARITLHEGRYHQVTRMFAALGNKVSSIHRVQVGPIKLGDLPVGQMRLLTEEDVQALVQNAEDSSSKPAPPISPSKPLSMSAIANMYRKKGQVVPSQAEVVTSQSSTEKKDKKVKSDGKKKMSEKERMLLERKKILLERMKKIKVTPNISTFGEPELVFKKSPVVKDPKSTSVKKTIRNKTEPQ